MARDESEIPALDELERRGRTNGVPGLRRLRSKEIVEIEPHCVGTAALHSPATGIVDFSKVAEALAHDVRAGGATVAPNSGVSGISTTSTRIALRHARGETYARYTVFCAGGSSDRLAVMGGAPADPRIVPFRGAYRRVDPQRRDLVKGLIYPAPEPDLPFLGVHLTRHIDGEVSLGPTALLPARRLRSTLAWPGT